MAISRYACNCLVLFVFILIVFFGCSNETDKAKNFITAGMYPQAIELLNKRIQEKPTDAEAQFQLGICFINTGNISEANKRFGSAVKLNADYGYQIGAEYKKAGIEALKQNNFKQAEINFNQAIHYQPKLKSSICDELKNIAETNLNLINLNLQNIEKANNTYQILARLNPSLNDEIAQKHLALFNEAKDEKFKSIIIDNAIKFSQQESITKAYADYHYDLSKLAKITKDAVSELKIANKFEHYNSELKNKQAQLKQKQFLAVVKKYENQWGPAKIIKLTKAKKWVPACTIKNGQRISYLSLHEFKIRDNINGEAICRKASNEKYSYRIYGGSSIKNEFKMFNTPTIVYYWVDKS